VDKKVAFQVALIEEVYLAVLRQCDFDARRFLALIASKGGWKTAKDLLRGSPPTGLRGLNRLGRLDLSLEHLVIQPQWRDGDEKLFTPDEIGTALQRLRRRRKRPEREVPSGVWLELRVA
jgi:hypothetical protein